MPAEIYAITEARLPDEVLIDGKKVNLSANTVRDGGRRQRMTPRSAAVLRYLAERPGRVVSRDELIESIWAGADPTDDVLSHAIAELRRLLGDNARAPRVIETIPKVGYRLIATPQPAGTVNLGESRAPLWQLGVAGLALALVSLGLGYFLGTRYADQPGVEGAGDNSALMERAVPAASGLGPERMPALSDDGRLVAYSAASSQTDQSDIFWRDLGGGPPRRLTETPEASEYSPVWSPDARAIAYLRFNADGCEVVVQPVHGGLSRSLGSCIKEAITYLDFSPDGRILAMTDSMGEARYGRVMLVDIASASVTPLDYEGPEHEHDVQAKFSPDGQWLAVRRGAQPRSRLVIIPATGGATTELTAEASRIQGYDWLPDSQTLWYCSDRDGRQALWEHSLGESVPRMVASACPYMMSIARTEPVVAFEYRQNDLELALLSGESGAPEAQFSSTRAEFYPQLAPDGRRLAFVSDRSGSDQLWFGDLETGEVLRLTDLDGVRPMHPRWSPDSRSLIFVGRGQSGEGLYEVSLQSGALQLRSEAGVSVRSAAYTADGRNFVIAEQRGEGPWRLVRQDRQSGERLILAEGSVHLPRDGTDGYVYYTRTDEYGLWRVPAGGGVPERVSDQIRFYNHENWLLAGGRLYFLSEDKESAMQVVAQPIGVGEEGEPEVVRELPTGSSWKLGDISPDGSNLWMVSAAQNQEDILVAPMNGRRSL